MLIAVIMAIAAGASVVLSRNINSILADKIGLFQGTLFNYIVGLFFSLIFLLLSGEFMKLSPSLPGPIPSYAYLGGLVGVIVVVMSNIVTPRISAFYLTLIIFIGQLFTGVIIDYFTQGLLSIGKVVGGLLVLLGLTYNLYIDKKADLKS